jgi:prolyl-tRNA synthetase
MRQSALFTKTRKEAPKDEVSKNAELLIRGGFIHKEMAGVYSYLPLGLKVLENISGIIREEMNAASGQEILMTVLQNKELWEKTGRWSDKAVGNWFKTSLKGGGELGLGFTHEEPLTNIMRGYISSYTDLPKLAYQIQWKFRNEERAKSGVMRGREFLMKDMYSFASSKEEHDKLYELVADAYVKIFTRLGIINKIYRTFASGGVFSKYSHEFQCLLPVGEDIIYVSKSKNIAINKEVKTPEVLVDLKVEESELKEERSVEVGNIFSLGTRFSEALGLTFKNKNGEDKPVIMGSYGLGPTRLMGVLVEYFSDIKGIIWPENIAPFTVHLIALGERGGKTYQEAESLYKKLASKKIPVLFDDREARAGEKFADADLIGIPHRIVISDQTIGKNMVEHKNRSADKASLITEKELMAIFTKSHV